MFWNSTQSSCQDAGGRTGDGGRKVGETGIEEVKQEKEGGSETERTNEEGKEGGREAGRKKEERVRPSNEGEK